VELMSTDQNEHMPRPGREEAGIEDSALLRRLRDRTFRTLDGRAFIGIDSDRGRKAVPIHGRLFRRWLGLEMEKESGERPPQAELRSAIDRLEVCAVDAPVADVHVRVALAGGRIYIDLADNCGRVIEVGPDGWQVIDNAPLHFIRTASMRPLPVPEKGGSIEDLRPLINVGDDGDFVLIVAFLLDALRNDGAHPVLVINGGEGTAKSTTAELLRELIDPSRAPFNGLPQSERQLHQAGDGYLRAFDNVSSISPKVSDALCRMSTGGSAHPVIINGTDDFAMRPDLADRGLFVNPAPVSDRQRRSKQEIWTTFETVRSGILGALLDAVAYGLRALPTTRLDALPRMADFALWVSACEPALWPEGTFMTAYRDNRADAAEKLIETDVVATAVQAFMANRPLWSGTATELDAILRATTNNIEGAKGWPAAPGILAARLNRLASSLGKTGITVTFKREGHDRKRVITLSSSADRPDPPTPGSRRASSDEETLGLGTFGAADAERAPEPESDKTDGSGPADDADGAEGVEDKVPAPGPADEADAADAADAVDDAVTTCTPGDGENAGDAAEGVDDEVSVGLADAADDADDEIKTSSFADRADAAHAVDDEVLASREADEADGELIDKNTTQVGAVLKRDRRIPVHRRASRSYEQQKPNDLGAPERDLYETDCRYDGEAGEIREAAITEGLEIEGSPGSAP
jgi:hypothetical protein